MIGEDAVVTWDAAVQLEFVEVADARSSFRFEAEGVGPGGGRHAHRLLLPGRPPARALHGVAADLGSCRTIDANAEDAARIGARDRHGETSDARHVDAVVAEGVAGIEEADRRAVVLELRALLRRVGFRLDGVADLAPGGGGRGFVLVDAAAVRA